MELAEPGANRLAGWRNNAYTPAVNNYVGSQEGICSRPYT